MSTGLVVGSSNSFVGDSYVGSIDTVAAGGWANITKVNNVLSSSISKVIDIVVASISKINGTAV